MKHGVLFLLCLAAPFAWAEVNVMSVTDETKHTQKEDFYHTFEYYISADGKKDSKCQATRIAPRWFATAAHCVQELCQEACSLQMDLLEAPVSVLAQTQHTAKNPVVFIHPGYKPGQLVQNDFALIRLDFNRAPKIYYRRKTGKTPNTALSQAQFEAWLARNPRTRAKYHHVLSPQLPPIAVFDNANYMLDRKVSVISIFNGKRDVKLNPHPVYYVKDLGYAYTDNFGIRPGMSGSGVMTNTGELIGIISAYVGADVYRGKQKIKHEDLFMFPVFNKSLVDFIQETLGSDWPRVEQKDAYPYLAQKTRKDFTEVLTLMKSNSKKP